MYQNRTPTIVNDQLVTLPKERQCQQGLDYVLFYIDIFEFF